MSFALKYPDGYFDSGESTVYFAVCAGCGWEDSVSYQSPDDFHFTRCPDCGCDDIQEEKEVA